MFLILLKNAKNKCLVPRCKRMLYIKKIEKLEFGIINILSLLSFNFYLKKYIYLGILIRI